MEKFHRQGSSAQSDFSHFEWTTLANDRAKGISGGPSRGGGWGGPLTPSLTFEQS